MRWMYSPEGRSLGTVQYGAESEYDKRAAESELRFGLPITPELTWHDGEQVQLRRPMAIQVQEGDVVDDDGDKDLGVSVTLSGLLSGCQIVVDGAVVAEPSQDFVEIKLFDPGTYTIMVQRWPYLDFVHAVKVI